MDGIKRLGGLWRHADFMKLWTAQTVSTLGSQVSFMALPLTAVLLLDASPIQMGVLEAMGAIPVLLLGLFAGVWADRHRRRPLLIGADVGRGLLLAAIPIGATLGLLRVEHLYIVAFMMGTLGLCFDVAHRAFLPSLVHREQLVEANSKLAVSHSVAEILGPGLAGALIQLVTAPLAIALDALSYLVSALFLGWIRAPEKAAAAPVRDAGVVQQIGAGIKLVLGDPTLRALALCLSTVYAFNSVLDALFMLYYSRELGLAPGLIGLIFAGGSVGFLAGALLPAWVMRHVGLGPGLIGGLFLLGLSDMVAPLLNRSMPIPVIVPALVVAQFLFGLGLTVYNVGQVSVRQGITPDHLQGRMNATMNFIASAVVPLGVLLGGALGETIGLRPTMMLAATGEILATGWLLSSPLRTLRAAALPQGATDQAGSP